jgi:hypothetical protein
MMADGETFNFGLNYTDFRKIVWTFVQAAVGYALAVWLTPIAGTPFNWRALAVGALAAGVSAVKNFALADGSGIK